MLAPQIMFDAGADVALYRDSCNVTIFGGVTFAPFRTSHAYLPPPSPSHDVATATR